MLKLLRNKKTAKKIWIALAIMVLPAFLFWGFGSFVRDGDSRRDRGKIAGREVTDAEFKESLLASRNLAIMQYGENAPEAEKKINLEAEARQRIALLRQAEELGVKASDEEVIKLIESYPFFQNNGRFDNRIYNELLRYVFRTQPRSFEEQTRQNIIISKLYLKVTDGITVEDKDVREGYIKIKSAQDKKFKFEEKKFLEEKQYFRQMMLEEKKQEKFSSFIEGLLK